MNLDAPDRLATFGVRHLDTADDPELNAIVQRVAKAIEAPIALISLVMGRVQYFRAMHGLPTELTHARATNRCDSFCQFVVRDEAIFLVEEALEDARVPKELVERYGIRAYAGAPLRVSGQVLGSLCVIDVRPRSFSREQINELERGAHEASQRLSKLSEIGSETLSTSGVEGDVEPGEAVQSMRRRLLDMRRALEQGAPIMRELASKPRSEWTVESLGSEAEHLADAAVFFRALGNRFEQTQALAKRVEQQVGANLLAAQLKAVAFPLSEGLTFVRVIEALAEEAIGVKEASRTLSVLHVALGFEADLTRALDDAIVAIENMGATNSAEVAT
ncbi:MAG: GAF domain-containing protein [Polyangiaceae bacterium]